MFLNLSLFIHGMKSPHIRKKSQLLKIAKENIDMLFTEAKMAYKEDKKLANRYIALARKTAMKYKLKMPRQYKRRFCKHCYHYLMPGDNCRVRTARGKVVYYCLDCKKYMRFIY